MRQIRMYPWFYDINAWLTDGPQYFYDHEGD